MECGDYIIEFDRTGFPLIRRKNWNFSISLFPVSKYQFERFMVEHGPKGSLYTDSWYRKLLEVGPRRSWRMCDDSPWEIFLAGVNIKEITPFLKYLGKGFKLPEARQWKKLFQVSGDIINMRWRLQQSCKDHSAPPVSRWLEEGLFPLVSEGVFEMVMDGNLQRCIGKPWQGLLPNLFYPENLRDVNWDICRQAVGFRVIREGHKE